MKKRASNPVLKAVKTSPYGSLRDRLLSHVNGLSRQQRLIAEYLLDKLHEVPFLSVPQLAQRAGASEATVVRLCKSIGFDGFSDMKMAVVENLREEMNMPSAAGEPSPGAATDVLDFDIGADGASTETDDLLDFDLGRRIGRVVYATVFIPPDVRGTRLAGGCTICLDVVGRSRRPSGSSCLCTYQHKWGYRRKRKCEFL